MKKMNDLPTYIITVKGNTVSESYASYVTPYWQRLGFNVETFDAITPATLLNYLKFKPINSKKYIDKGFVKDHTPTEKAVWYSHCELWKLCVKHDTPIVVLEHDVIPTEPQNLIWCGVDYQVFDRGALGCYVITPEFAQWMLDFLINKHGVVDSGPGGMIDWVHNFPAWKRDRDRHGIDIIVHRDQRYRPACTQIIDRRFGTVIDHYSGTCAAQYEWGEFSHYQEVQLDL